MPRDLPGSRRYRRRLGGGQAIVEFALVAPILMALLGGIIQFGVIFWGQNTLNQIARDTGRWAATQVSCGDGFKAQVVSTANAIADESSLIGYAGNPSAFTVTTVEWVPATACIPKTNQDVVWVRVSLQYKVPIFFPAFPFGTISSSAEFRMEPAPQ